jgi:hypothetical protein
VPDPVWQGGVFFEKWFVFFETDFRRRPCSRRFFWQSPRAGTPGMPMMAEVLHERGDAAVQLVPNSLAQAQSACADE